MPDHPTFAESVFDLGLNTFPGSASIAWDTQGSYGELEALSPRSSRRPPATHVDVSDRSTRRRRVTFATEVEFPEADSDPNNSEDANATADTIGFHIHARGSTSLPEHMADLFLDDPQDGAVLDDGVNTALFDNPGLEHNDGDLAASSALMPSPLRDRRLRRHEHRPQPPNLVLSNVIAQHAIPVRTSSRRAPILPSSTTIHQPAVRSPPPPYAEDESDAEDTAEVVAHRNPVPGYYEDVPPPAYGSHDADRSADEIILENLFLDATDWFHNMGQVVEDEPTRWGGQCLLQGSRNYRCSPSIDESVQMSKAAVLTSPAVRQQHWSALTSQVKEAIMVLIIANPSPTSATFEIPQGPSQDTQTMPLPSSITNTPVDNAQVTKKKSKHRYGKVALGVCLNAAFLIVAVPVVGPFVVAYKGGQEVVALFNPELKQTLRAKRAARRSAKEIAKRSGADAGDDKKCPYAPQSPACLHHNLGNNAEYERKLHARLDYSAAVGSGEAETELPSTSYSTAVPVVRGTVVD